MLKLTIKVTSDEMTNVKVMKFQHVTKPNDKLKNDKKKTKDLENSKESQEILIKNQKPKS